MYTVRYLPNSNLSHELVTSREGLSMIISILESTKSCDKFQVWSAGIGMVKQEDFGWGGYLKWTTEPFFGNKQ